MGNFKDTKAFWEYTNPIEIKKIKLIISLYLNTRAKGKVFKSLCRVKALASGILKYFRIN